MAVGIYRVRAIPNVVQVQFGPFARPISEEAYRHHEYVPPLETLPWLKEEGAKLDKKDADP